MTIRNSLAVRVVGEPPSQQADKPFRREHAVVRIVNAPSMGKTVTTLRTPLSVGIDKAKGARRNLHRFRQRAREILLT